MPFVPDPTRMEVVSEEIAAILRTKTPAEKVAMASAAHRTARLLISARIMTLHPDWSEQQVRAEVLRRMIGGTA